MFSYSLLIFLFGLLHGIQADHVIDVMAENEKEEIEKVFFTFSLEIGLFHIFFYFILVVLFSLLGSFFPFLQSFQVCGIFLLIFGGYVLFLFFFRQERVHQHDHAHEHLHAHEHPVPHVRSDSSAHDEEKQHTHSLPAEIDKGKVGVAEDNGHAHTHEHDHQHLHMHVEGKKKKHFHTHYKSILSKAFQVEDFLFLFALAAFTVLYPPSFWLVCAVLLLAGLIVSAFLSGVFFRMGGVGLMEKSTNASHFLSGLMAVLAGLYAIF